ncbi:hypothetical protein Tco_1124327, partial [Tanacetum coccineum]
SISRLTFTLLGVMLYSAIGVAYRPSRFQYADNLHQGAKVQLQVERKVQEHMRQRELEANAHEEAREREWQRKMDDINSMLRKFNDPRPPQ